MQELRLHCSLFYVDVRLREFNGRWIASSRHAGRTNAGLGNERVSAIWMALEPFDGVIDELVASLSDELTAPFWQSS